MVSLLACFFFNCRRSSVRSSVESMQTKIMKKYYRRQDRSTHLLVDSSCNSEYWMVNKTLVLLIAIELSALLRFTYPFGFFKLVFLHRQCCITYQVKWGTGLVVVSWTYQHSVETNKSCNDLVIHHGGQNHPWEMN